MQILVNIYQLIMLILMLASTYAGLLANFLFIYLAITCVYMVMLKLIQLLRKQIVLIPRLPRVAAVPMLGLALLRCFSWIILGVCITYSMIPIQFPGNDYTSVNYLIWLLVGILSLCAFFPAGKFSVFSSIIYAFKGIFLAVVLLMACLPPDHVGLRLHAPFKGQWYVFQGGHSPLVSHHYFAGSQEYALDFIRPEDGTFSMAQQLELEDFKSFNQPIYAPIDGEVHAVVSSLDDNPFGQVDPNNPIGNHVIIRTTEGAYLLLAHLKKDSILVTPGLKIQRGRLLGYSGNSGNSTQPHLHIQAMDKPDTFESKTKPLQILFQNSRGEFRSLRRNDRLLGLQEN